MISDLISYLENKNILILGFGREGRSSYNFFKKYMPMTKITIADKNPIEVEHSENISIITGDMYLECLNKFDIVFKSPGISLKNITNISTTISSQMDLFLKFCPATTIGITGTKGKTTTTTLIYEILKLANKDCFLLGNIGVPVFDCIDKITADSIAVIEMSSHQLEFMKHSPNISIITNFYQEHLDHYLSYEHYINSKLNIFRYQKNSDYSIFNFDQSQFNEMITSTITSNNSIPISMESTSSLINSISIDENYNIIETKNFQSKKYFSLENLNNNLLGKHHYYDILFAFAVTNILNIKLELIFEALKNFNGIPHRMEYVGTFNEILFYNDSIATIPEAVINAVEALKNVDTLIIGGLDRGIDYTEFVEFLIKSSINNIICLYDTGIKIASLITSIDALTSKVHIASNLEDAVKKAFKYTHKDKICLLSPAAASYGYFKNFEERGNEYKRLITEFSKM